jgi:hypothetical protein
VATEEPGAKPSEQHKVEGGGDGTERRLDKVGVESSGLLILAHELGEKEDIVMREEEALVKAENEKGKGSKELEMGDGEANKAEDKPEEEQRSKEPEMGGPEPVKPEVAEEISGSKRRKRGSTHMRDMLVGFLRE